MSQQQLRTKLDGLSEQELLRMRESVEQSPDGSTHEVEGVEIDKDQLLALINQSLVIAEP